MPCVGEVTLSRELWHCLSLHSWHKEDTLLGLAYSPAPHLWACRCLHLHLRLTWQSRARLSADSFVDEISSKFCFLIQPTYKWKSWFMLEYLVEVSCKKCQSDFRSLHFYLHFSTTTLKLHNGFPWFSPPLKGGIWTNAFLRSRRCFIAAVTMWPSWTPWRSKHVPLEPRRRRLFSLFFSFRKMFFFLIWWTKTKDV